MSGEPFALHDQLQGFQAQRTVLRERIRALRADFSTIPATELADLTREVLDETSSPPSRAQNATAGAILLGLAERERLTGVEGGHISADEARTFLKLSKPALLDRFKKGRVLGWWQKNAVRFPVWQFAPEGGLLPGLEEVLELLHAKPSYDEWAKVLFFLNRKRSLGDQRPLDLLRAGNVKDVLDLAELDD